MQENEPQNAAFYWSTTFVRSLFEEGIEHVVISPGSRSTALTLAFAAHSGFKKHVAIDERSAAFTALGIGKYTGNPAVLVCTSGTAAANYYPAVIEAAQSGIPMIILSADRPPHYRELGASQTIDQLKLFGNYPVFFHEIGEPDTHQRSRNRLKLAASQAVQQSVQKEGVAHLNFPFTKPFEPDRKYLRQVEFENEKQSRRPSPKYSREDGAIEMGETFWSDLISAERPLIVVGPTNKSDQLQFITPLARALDAPILAEPGSQVPTSRHTIQGFDGFLKNETNREELNADLILRFGAQPVSKAVNQFLDKHSEAMQISFMGPNRWVDGSLSSDKQVTLKGPLKIPEVTGAADKEWMKKWRKIEKDFKTYREQQLHPSAPITDGYVFSKVMENIPKKAFTMLSNSFPVRDMSLFGEFDGKDIYVNRGAAGIDGITSTALGISLASEKPGVLFVGDIAFLHDTNGLLMAKKIKHPLVIVLLNNGGGTIFRMLPVHQIKSKYTPYFETPQTAKVAALCRAHNIDHTLVSRPEQIIATFERLIQRNGVHVMECMTGADESMEQRHALWNFDIKKDA
ncbi:MAG: 2-succinyl-5-enolpyruvyl-6-hydroxy-3-cyclohexene-1-carboxylic-acid synthase [Gracilimonas sp.]|uniref:2-succinyl-5-enolpyruvyl-6-hydroxy-3- cyclohexene-1-carboxylic-acid synthase n=1 Tax=Gracilimonas sp. TaxID=1974203 RepID=UPI001B2E9ADE|nr:2-succinyl-5-enolpyruvyl-6-hydroxy-3-cyclohexene-1-carboxylic-acid synthase [Gracilimonas sp.]MBO6586183.1 2-succinyl-5-enolpyruvyl-6-hydroxy-3-cyclohexene-1-carboxylic-acid synthase [Gracilimonas sp.]MBO6614840.1 2-succinyl-5-enolpyruvyl-6-hydroxy-3-cyclohexene-1-carboxylic-acid synthase [Gracilimonas sp.]